MALLLAAAYQYYKIQLQDNPEGLTFGEIRERIQTKFGVDILYMQQYTSVHYTCMNTERKQPENVKEHYLDSLHNMQGKMRTAANPENESHNKNKNKMKGRVRRRDESVPLNIGALPEEPDNENITSDPTTTHHNYNSNNSNNANNNMQDKIRQDWIDAVFGPDFFPNNKNNNNQNYKPPPRQGMGLAQIQNYVTYQASIPPPPKTAFDGMPLEQGREPKLGMTLSKLSLGLYVTAVDPESEAAYAGVQPGSILVDINGMGMLAETSRHALERIWQYEGRFSQQQQQQQQSTASTMTKGKNSASTNTSANNNANKSNDTAQSNTTTTTDERPNMQQPLAMRFIKDGQQYNALFVANPPYGITWASCGDFCLVNRSYSYASSIGGVKRGSIVASINGRATIRNTEDHLQFGALLQKLFQERSESIQLWLCFTPAAARTGYFERGMMMTMMDEADHIHGSSNHTTATKAKTNTATTTQKSNDGVEIRFHSLEESLQSFWGNATQVPCSSSSSSDPWKSVIKRRHIKKPSSTQDLQGSVAELANKVVAGEITTLPASAHWSRRQRVYGPCPLLPNPILLRIWEPLPSLIYCLSFYQHLVSGENSTFVFDGGTDNSKALKNIRQLATDDMIHTFLWQCISLIATSPAAEADYSQRRPPVKMPSETNLVHASEEKKDYAENDAWLATSQPDLSLPPRPLTTGHASTTSTPPNHGEVLTSFLLKMSRKDQNFCQKLYFCLRSTLTYLDLEASSSSGSDSDPKPNQHNHLQALFNCLKLLRSAEREAADGGSFGAMMSVEQQWPPNDDAGCCNELAAGNANADNATLGASEMSISASSSCQQKPAKRGIFKLFRKMKMKKSKKKKAAAAAMETAPEQPSSPVRSQPQTPRRVLSSHSHLERLHLLTTPMLENMSEFVKELDGVCISVEKKLLKSFSQKITDWALQPWTASKSSVLTTLTEGMRQSLSVHSGKVDTSLKKRRGWNNRGSPPFCLVNPLHSNELLVGIDAEECYILPSAHFPLLLTFDAIERPFHSSNVLNTTLPSNVTPQQGRDQSYRIKVEVCSFASPAARLVLHGAIGGAIQESYSSASANGIHVFRQKLQFETRSSSGAPRTLSLRLSNMAEDEEEYGLDRSGTSGQNQIDSGYGWIDLVPLWNRLERFKEPESFCTALIYSMADYSFDEQGKLITTTSSGEKLRPLRLEFKVTTEIVAEEADSTPAGPFGATTTHKRMLLYKHDDDLRQEAFAIQFIQMCDSILKAYGLDLKLLTFGCIPVGANRGFIEWVRGSVPLSDICQKPFASVFGNTTPASTTNRSANEEKEEEDGSAATGAEEDDEDDMSIVAKSGMSNYESLYHMGMAGVGTAAATAMKNTRALRPTLQGSIANNPIQDFLRSIAFDPNAPYFVRRDVMDTYVKSCAGYCVITYLLGVGDRHLDNLLLHNQTGSFFHCDYSFLFGNDPKKYLPMRVTEAMIYGMGGRESDNYAKFLSLAGSSFLTLRRPENVRFLLSLVRVMENARLPDISQNLSTTSTSTTTTTSNIGGNSNHGEERSTVADVVLGMRQRLRLDLTEDQAVAFMEEMIEASLSSKLWLAVDAIHSLGKRF